MRRATARRCALRPTEIFLSHASKDRRFAVRLAERLRRDGFSVWYSERHIAGPQQWHDEIGAALRRCDWFLLVLSPSAVRSKWVKYELLYALRSTRYNDRIVIFRVRLISDKREVTTVYLDYQESRSNAHRSEFRPQAVSSDLGPLRR